MRGEFNIPPLNLAATTPRAPNPTQEKEEVGHGTSHSSDPPPAHLLPPFSIPEAQVPAGQALHGGWLKALCFTESRCWKPGFSFAALHLAKVPALGMGIMEIPGFDI